jgi:[protein-PII] uridylyltransferase
MPDSSVRAIDLGRLAPSLGDTCGDYLTSYRGELERAIDEGHGGVAVSRRFARSLDGLLSALACAADAASRSVATVRGRIALVANGSYGRGLIALHSDIDVLFLCDDPDDPHAHAYAEGLLYPLWDLGLRIGHAVRGVEETVALAREDIRTATTLIDLRRIAGNREIVGELRAAGRRRVFEPALEEFLDALADDTEKRHERYGDSLYLLEPEVKLGRGGLRDIDVAEWALRARFGIEELGDAVKTGAILAREIEELETAREMLCRVRNILHRRAGRVQDRLTFADQEHIAEQLGFVDGITLGVEQFMQAYYRHAEVVAKTAERMLVRARRDRRTGPVATEDLGDGTMLFDGKVTFRDSKELAADPALALRLYLDVLKASAPPYEFARDAIVRATNEPEFGERLRASGEARRAFLSLLGTNAVAKVRRGSVIGELHEVGLLVAMVPEFAPLVGRVIHDDYHVYTVDVHAIRAVETLARLFRGDARKELPLACRLAAETPRKEALFVATLIHDLAKAGGAPTGDRRSRERYLARAGALGRTVAVRLELAPADVDHVVWLVTEQNSLYDWATRRDTSDPETVREIVERIASLERLRDLYLFTIAVVASVNPKAMNAWTARMLDDLFLAVASAFDGGATRSPAGRVAALREEVRTGFAGDEAEDELDEFVRAMPDRYVLANPVDAIRTHARAVRDRKDAPIYIRLSPGPTDELSELFVVTDDRPGLLADIAAVLTANRLSVVTAQVYTRVRAGRRDEAVDIFHVRRAGRRDPVDPKLLRKVTSDLGDLLEGRVSANELLARIPKTPAWARRHTPEPDTEVIVDNAVSSRFTVVDVFTRDRIGLLHFLARKLHELGLSIALSKINTEGTRAADVFYVENVSGGRITDPERLSSLPRALRDAVVAFHADAEAREP